MTARVLIWSLGRRGAAPTHTLETARALMRRGDLELSLGISTQASRFDDLAALGLPLLAIDTYPARAKPSLLPTLWRLPRAFFAFARFLRRQKIDIVFCPFSHPWNVVFIPLIHFFGCRYVLKVHDGAVHPGDDVSSPQRLIDAEILRADGLVAMTEHVKRQIVSRLGIEPSAIAVAPMGPYEMGAAPRRENAAPTRLLFFGRIMAYKGIDTLLDAFEALRLTHPSLTLTIAGSGDFSPYAARARRLGVEADIRYIPEDEIPAIFSKADIVVLPHREATQSGIVSLAQVAGIPAVAMPVGGLVEQIEDGVTGIVADQATAEGLARAVSRLLDDKALYAAVSEGGLVRSRMVWDVAAVEIAALIRRVDAVRPPRSFWMRGPKRLFDIVASSLALVVASPFALVIAVLVRLDLGAPVLFRHTRPGLRGRPFELLKFRTMRDATDAGGRPLADRERLTPFGRLLRSTSLDELPELWNVLRGDMSLVGPRPLLTDYLAVYTQEQVRRHALRPGLTGWAQVNGRNAQSWDARFRFDLFYVENGSFLLDLRIILLTIWHVLARRGISAEGHETMPRFDDEVRAGRAEGRRGKE